MSQLDLQIEPLHQWITSLKKILWIAGPCSAESEEQIVRTAKSLDEAGFVNVFRAGIWKPRTRPNSFEGLGVKALPWLSYIKRNTSLLTAVEVANAEHVEACLQHDVDILWIGSRTTVNPFSVQEIADAIEGVDIPVMVKNPINPDLNLWIGALERIHKAGISKLIAIHRGFSSYENIQFRNSPRWEIPLQLKTLCPQLPIICDPQSYNRQKKPYRANSSKGAGP